MASTHDSASRATAAQRILVIGPLPPPPGGGETVTQVLLDSDLGQSYTLRHFDITRRRGKEDMGRLTARNAWGAIQQVRSLAGVLRAFRPHLVHVPIASAPGALLRDRLFADLARRAGARLVLHPHAGKLIERYRAAPPPWRAFIRALLSRADAIICLSAAWQTFYAQLAPNVRTRIIHNPIHPDFATALDALPDEPRTTDRVLFVGAICRPKGVPELLEALDRVMDDEPRLVARLVGDKQYRGDQARIVGQHSALRHEDRIELAGPLYGEDLVREFKAATMLVLPSHFEAVPMVIVEGMAAGLPIIATRVGGIPDLIEDGEHGALIEPGDIDGLERALRRMLGAGEGSRRIGERNRRLAMHRHDAAVFVRACDDLYREVLSRGERRG